MKNCKGLSSSVLVNVVVFRTCWPKSDRRGKHGVHCLEVIAFVGVRNFSLFFIVFVPIGCFKNVLFRKTIMGGILLNVSLKLPFMLNMCRCFFVIFLIFGSNRLCVTKMGLSLYVWVYNVLKVMIHLADELSQFAFIRSIH